MCWLKKIPDFTGLVTTTVLNANIAEGENKIPDGSGLVTTTFYNAKIREVGNKILSVSDLAKETDFNAKISDVEAKYSITFDCNKITAEILEIKIKEKVLVDQSSISFLVKNSGLNTKLATLAKKKAELKTWQNKIVKL